MNKSDIALLYEYDRWATNRVLQSASALTQEQLTRDLGGSFCSLRDTLLHIIEGVWGWLTYWKEPLPNPAFLKDLQDRRSLLFRPTAFPDLTAICRKWTEVEREQIQFVDSVLRKRSQRWFLFAAPTSVWRI